MASFLYTFLASGAVTRSGQPGIGFVLDAALINLRSLDARSWRRRIGMITMMVEMTPWTERDGCERSWEAQCVRPRLLRLQ